MMLDFNSSWWVGTADSGEFDMSPWQNHTNNVAWSNRLGGDFNGDGRSDVALVQTDAAKLRVGISDGTEFDFSVWADHANPEFWGPVIVGDFDGNGSDDLAEYDNLHERWRVYRLVDGQPAKETWYDFSVSDPAWSDHVVGDYDGNGFDDILSVDSATGDLIVLFSDGTRLTPSPWQSLPNDDAWSFVQSGDYDGDGRDDLAAFDPVTATWWITRGSAGTGGQAPVAWYTFSDASQDWGAQVTGDFNNDGKSDIAGYNRANGKLKVLTSSGEGFDKLVWAKISAKDRVTQVIPLDVNADGLTDLGAWDPTRRKWWVARSTGEAFKVSGWGRLLR